MEYKLERDILIFFIGIFQWHKKVETNIKYFQQLLNGIKIRKEYFNKGLRLNLEIKNSFESVILKITFFRIIKMIKSERIKL